MRNKIIPLLVTLLTLAVVFGSVACEIKPLRVYGIGATYESYDSSIKLNSVACTESINTDETLVSAGNGKKFLVLNVTIKAKEDLILENERFMVNILDVVADAQLSKGLNYQTGIDGDITFIDYGSGNVDYLSNYELASGDTVTFKVVFLFDVVEDATYSVQVHNACFTVDLKVLDAKSLLVQCLDSYGKPIINAEITVTGMTNREIAMIAKTDAEGKFIVRGVKNSKITFMIVTETITYKQEKNITSGMLGGKELLVVVFDI
ncbi:MAG: DUF4352 domain-containing protein [Dehalococcoidia bacterium]|nr:DUF4352 domain-containing protein [Dehalococcoidia bacterium]